MDNKLDLRYNDAFQVTRQKIQIKKKNYPHILKRLDNCSMCQNSSTHSVEHHRAKKSAGVKTLDFSEKKKNVLHHY